MAKSTGKAMEFCQSEKVATLSLLVARYSHLNDGFWLKKNFRLACTPIT